jgi:hypothetical protein
MPDADAGEASTVACIGPRGARVTLDGTGSSDPDSTPGTNDDIMAFDWFENYGQPVQVFIGEGETLTTYLSGGVHAVTLRVTDRFGMTDTDEVSVTVTDDCRPEHELMKLISQDGGEGDRMGFSVALSGATAVVGASRDDDLGSDSGSAYVFTRDDTTWETTKLLAPDGGAKDLFGYRVAVSGDTVIVGASQSLAPDPDSGSAYVFVRGDRGWTLQAKLVPDDGEAGDVFGISVAIEGNLAVVGAGLDDDLGWGSGSAYVFTRNGEAWTQEAKLLADDGSEADYFGWVMAISGDTVVVGAPGYEFQTGAAYVFKRDNSGDGPTWIQEAKLMAVDAAERDWFALSVAISGDAAVVGSRDGGDPGVRSGCAYVFARDSEGWTQQAKLLARDREVGDWFGYGTAIEDDTVLIGAPQQDDLGTDSGSVYVFVHDGGAWTQERSELLPSSGTPGDLFGNSVALSGGIGLVGAPDADAPATDSRGCLFLRSRSAKQSTCGQRGGGRGPGVHQRGRRHGDAGRIGQYRSGFYARNQRRHRVVRLVRRPWFAIRGRFGIRPDPRDRPAAGHSLPYPPDHGPSRSDGSRPSSDVGCRHRSPRGFGPCRPGHSLAP